MTGLYKSSIKYSRNTRFTPPSTFNKGIQIFKLSIEEKKIKPFIDKQTKVVDLTQSSGFLLEKAFSDYNNDKINLNDNGQVILESLSKGFYDGLTLCFRYCNCATKSGELYYVKLEYIGETLDKPTYTRQPIRF